MLGAEIVRFELQDGIALVFGFNLDVAEVTRMQPAAANLALRDNQVLLTNRRPQLLISECCGRIRSSRALALAAQSKRNCLWKPGAVQVDIFSMTSS
jgi:hypothetical protein